MNKGPGDEGKVDHEHQHLLSPLLTQAQMGLGRFSMN